MTDPPPALTDERRGRIVALLEHLTDGLPVPTREPMSRAGFVHSTTFHETCPDCFANADLPRRGRIGSCETCGGKRYVVRRRTRDPYDTGRSLRYVNERLDDQRDREREIARLEATLGERPDEHKVTPYGWELERKRLRSRYRLPLLELALEDLRRADGDACRALHAVYVFGWLPAAGAVMGPVDRGLVFLSGLLPELLHAPTSPRLRVVPALSHAERAAQMRKLSREGMATQWIAGSYGLSVSQTNRIISGDGRS